MPAEINVIILTEVNMHFVIGAPQRVGPPAKKQETKKRTTGSTNLERSLSPKTSKTKIIPPPGQEIQKPGT